MSSCNWCHEIVDFSDHFCSTCRHAAHLARMDCDCNRCGGQRASANKGYKPDAKREADYEDYWSSHDYGDSVGKSR